MIKNYLTIALRNFWRNKLFTFINIIGLSIGISAAIVIYLIVNYDFTFDKFHKDGDRIYRVVTNFSFQGQRSYNGGVCGPMAEAIKSQVPGVAVISPMFTLYSPNVFVVGKNNVPVRFKSQDDVVLASPTYFELFNYKWVAGSPKTALNQPNQVVLTTAQAKKYFGEIAFSQMIGKVVSYDSLKTTVMGIIATQTQHTDLTFHDFISYSTATANGAANKDLLGQMQLQEWQSTNSASQLFIKLQSTSTIKLIEKQLNQIYSKHNPPTHDNKGSSQSFSLQRLSDLHFTEKYGIFDSTSRIANKTTLYGLLAIALFLLLLACINFINLTTAQATQRTKEIGVRKTMGSSQRQLIFQFLSETFLISLIAVLISIAFLPLILNLFSSFIPNGVKFNITDLNLIVFIILLIAIVSITSGFYPALVLSRLKPAFVLKNQQNSGSSNTRKAWLRKSLTVTQFVIAQFFIIATVLVGKQIYYALHKDMGFKKDAIIYLGIPFKNPSIPLDQTFITAIKAIPQVDKISQGGAPPSSNSVNSTVLKYLDGKKEITTDVDLKAGDENYGSLYGLKFLAGRNFRNDDSTKRIVINNTCAKVLGFNNPKDAIAITLTGLSGKSKTQTVIGVVADFYQGSFHTAIKPVVLFHGTNLYQKGTIHIALKPETPNGHEWKLAIAAIEKTYKSIYPDEEFKYNFFDDSIAKFYESEQHTSTLLTWATGLSILISSLGLLGLTIYTTNQRTKEIGVRKVLGASVTQLVALLSKELSLLILLAFVITTPLAWIAMNKWMQSFADRTAISWWIFALSGGGMFLIALVTSGFQTVKAAIANPVKSLRSE